MPHDFKRGDRVEWNFRGRRVVGRVRRVLTSRTVVNGRHETAAVARSSTFLHPIPVGRVIAAGPLDSPVRREYALKHL